MSRPVLAALLALVARATVAGADPFASAIVSMTIGPLGGGGSPQAVLGPPRGGGPFQGGSDTLSLGRRGVIVLDLAAFAMDGPGADLTVFENAFLVRGTTTFPPFAEPARVSVSADGVHFRTFPCAIDAAPYFPGCAGVYPTFATDAASALVPSTAPIETLVGVPVDDFVVPAGSGGDSFDLATVGLAAARFVRIQGGTRQPGLDGLGGFDLDAVAALHAVELDGSADADGDGVPDGVDDCPGVPDPDQSDVDGDGHGDACDAEAPPADGDGDGVPDRFDVCPLDADPGQEDGDADGVGDACDRCPGADDPPPPAPCPALPPDADFDGSPDGEDPCPADPACGPLEPPVFAGTGRGRGEWLLAYVLPAERRVVVAAGTPALQLAIVVAADVAPGSVRVRVGRHDRTAALGPFVPGSTRTVTIPLGGRRTRIRLAARGSDGTKDRDRFIVVRKRTRGERS